VARKVEVVVRVKGGREHGTSMLLHVFGKNKLTTQHSVNNTVASHVSRDSFCPGYQYYEGSTRILVLVLLAHLFSSRHSC